MSESAEYSLQQGIYQKLSGDAGLAALAVNGVLDFVPESLDCPYVVIGEPTSIPFDTCDSNGQEHTITIHSWSKYNGKKEVAKMMGLIYGLLQKAELSLIGHEPIVCLFQYSEIMKDPDGVTHHGVQRFRVLTTEEQ